MVSKNKAAIYADKPTGSGLIMRLFLFDRCTKYQYSPPMHRSTPMMQPTMIPAVAPEALSFFIGLLGFFLGVAAMGRCDGARVGVNMGGCWTTWPEAVGADERAGDGSLVCMEEGVGFDIGEFSGCMLGCEVGGPADCFDGDTLGACDG